MMKPVLTRVFLAVVLTAGSAEAGMYNMIGAGVSSCGVWIADRRDGGSSPAALQDEEWVLGFLPGVGYGTASLNPLNGMDAEGVAAWIGTYCRKHPIATIGFATDAFVATSSPFGPKVVHIRAALISHLLALISQPGT
jgi:hypothetical protein